VQVLQQQLRKPQRLFLCKHAHFRFICFHRNPPLTARRRKFLAGLSVLHPFGRRHNGFYWWMYFMDNSGSRWPYDSFSPDGKRVDRREMQIYNHPGDVPNIHDLMDFVSLCHEKYAPSTGIYTATVAVVWKQHPKGITYENSGASWLGASQRQSDKADNPRPLTEAERTMFWEIEMNFLQTGKEADGTFLKPFYRTTYREPATIPAVKASFDLVWSKVKFFSNNLAMFALDTPSPAIGTTPRVCFGPHIIKRWIPAKDIAKKEQYEYEMLDRKYNVRFSCAAALPLSLSTMMYTRSQTGGVRLDLLIFFLNP
jgi:hypothetical protein